MALESPESYYNDNNYFPPPLSIHPLPDELHRGLLAIGFFATLSVVLTASLIAFMTYRIFAWRKFYDSAIGYNQNLALVYNLLVGDLILSSSLVTSFHWIDVDGIFSPTCACNWQGALMNVGNVSSGLFVLFIAIETMMAVLYRHKLSNSVFFGAVASCWIFSVALAAIGPSIHGEKYFTRAGAWCWASKRYSFERMALQYIWIFIIQGGTIVMYLITFIFLRRQIAKTASITQSSTTSVHSRVNRATFYMLLYPLAYVLCTLPVAAGRMSSMASHADNSDTFYVITGSLLTSCGWINSILYTLTRHTLVSSGSGPCSSPRRWPSSAPHPVRSQREDDDGWDLTTLGSIRPTTHTIITSRAQEQAASKPSTLTRLTRILSAGHLRDGANGNSHSGSRNHHRSLLSGSFNDRRVSGAASERGVGSVRRPESRRRSPGVPGLGGVKAETTVEVSIRKATKAESADNSFRMSDDDTVEGPYTHSWNARSG